MASTETMTYEDSLNSQYISSSLSSLSRSKSTNNLIVRTYKQATQFYLTKRFVDAWDTLEPIVSASAADAQPPAPAENGASTNGDANGHQAEPPRNAPAPVAQSARGTRIRVWVFYLSLLNSIIELGAEEGRLVFGSARWKEIAAKVREGSVWEEVVARGYGGSEGEVDADVVANLATLLLAHMPDQRLNQQRLESYLAASDSPGSGANGHLSYPADGMSTPMSATSSSPKALATRLKILELYTLHVLPANGEWEYARTFIEINDTLDEERSEAFLAALQNLKEEKDGTAQRQRELEEQREREMEQQRREEEEEAARQAEAARQEEEEERRRAAETERQKKAAQANALNGTAGSHKAAPKALPSSASSSSHHPSSKPSKAQKKKGPSPPPTFYRRASSMFTNLQQMLVQAGQGLNSMAVLRLLMFLVAFLLIVARRDLRMKIRRAVDDGWVKVKQTIGMGVKVSYI